MPASNSDHSTSEPNLPPSGDAVPAPVDPFVGTNARALVTRILVSHALATDFSDDDILAEVGMTSMDMVDLLLAVESTFDVEVPQHDMTPDVFRSVATIDALIRRLRSPVVPV